MSAAAISGAASGASVNPNSFAELQSQEFMRVLVTELSNQDPFDPQDSSALLAQLSSIRNIESQLVLQEKLETLILQNQISAAGGLIGRLVTGLDANQRQVNGIVMSVRVQGGQAMLELDSGETVAMDRVTRIDSGDVNGA